MSNCVENNAMTLASLFFVDDLLLLQVENFPRPANRSEYVMQHAHLTKLAENYRGLYETSFIDMQKVEANLQERSLLLSKEAEKSKESKKESKDSALPPQTLKAVEATLLTSLEPTKSASTAGEQKERNKTKERAEEKKSQPELSSQKDSPRRSPSDSRITRRSLPIFSKSSLSLKVFFEARCAR